MIRYLLRAVLWSTLAGSAQAAPAAETILDYRDPGLRNGAVASAPAERARVAQVLAEEAPGALRAELGANFVVLGQADGAFDRPGGRARIYLVQEKQPVAIEPFPNAAAPVLVVLTEGAPARFFRLPKDVQYQRLVAAVDADRDGRSEVLLESAFTNMGESVTALTVVKLDPGGGARPVQVIRDVVSDRCEGGAARGRSAATVFRDASGALAVRRHEVGCR